MDLPQWDNIVAFPGLLPTRAATYDFTLLSLPEGLASVVRIVVWERGRTAQWGNAQARSSQTLIPGAHIGLENRLQLSSELHMYTHPHPTPTLLSHTHTILIMQMLFAAEPQNRDNQLALCNF